MVAALLMKGADLHVPSVEEFDVAIGMVAKPESDLTPEQRELREALGLSAG